MQIDSASKDLSLKQMTFKIIELNKLIKKNGYNVARILTKTEALERGYSNEDKLVSILEKGKSMTKIVTEILKVTVKSISWNSLDSVVIDYLEK